MLYVDSRNCNVDNCATTMIMICVRRTDPFLGVTINKSQHIIPRANQSLENSHVVNVDHFEEFDKHFIRFNIPPLLCIE